MDAEKIKQATRLYLEGLGEDPDRPGLIDTPDRVARMCEEIYSGVGTDPRSVMKTLNDDEHDEIVLVRDIPFYSICEHHLLPFHGKAHVAYLPVGKICGLSKMGRVLQVVARRPQLQERLTTEVADVMMETLEPRGVMVVIEAEHLCMSMRGLRCAGAITTTSAVRGIFRENPATRAETLSLIHSDS